MGVDFLQKDLLDYLCRSSMDICLSTTALKEKVTDGTYQFFYEDGKILFEAFHGKTKIETLVASDVNFYLFFATFFNFYKSQSDKIQKELLVQFFSKLRKSFFKEALDGIFINTIQNTVYTTKVKEQAIIGNESFYESYFAFQFLIKKSNDAKKSTGISNPVFEIQVNYSVINEGSGSIDRRTSVSLNPEDYGKSNSAFESVLRILKKIDDHKGNTTTMEVSYNELKPDFFEKYSDHFLIAIGDFLKKSPQYSLLFLNLLKTSNLQKIIDKISYNPKNISDKYSEKCEKPTAAIMAGFVKKSPRKVIVDAESEPESKSNIASEILPPEVNLFDLESQKRPELTPSTLNKCITENKQQVIHEQETSAESPRKVIVDAESEPEAKSNIASEILPPEVNLFDLESQKRPELTPSTLNKCITENKQQVIHEQETSAADKKPSHQAPPKDRIIGTGFTYFPGTPKPKKDFSTGALLMINLLIFLVLFETDHCFRFLSEGFNDLFKTNWFSEGKESFFSNEYKDLSAATAAGLCVAALDAVYLLFSTPKKVHMK